MTPAAAVPLAEFTPYLLQQTRLRASLLLASFGFATDDWDDLRQDLALDCLRRLPRFDSSRGDWKGFVRGVVRNHSCVLASRQVRRPEILPLEIDPHCETADDRSAGGTHDTAAENLGPALDLRLDTQRVLASLPEDLRMIARYLTEMPVSAVRRKAGLSQSQVERKVRRIRSAFVAAGIKSGGVISNRGAQ